MYFVQYLGAAENLFYRNILKVSNQKHFFQNKFHFFAPLVLFCAQTPAHPPSSPPFRAAVRARQHIRGYE
jgi:hypothetical protein